ncbi:ras association domain-containing protein 8-like isoform X2 [Watersipora subatra]|uniref:ras association domain-containing protein 8-like isoform X2 n=1 Tax=Watersipora subatra TaxID=2589382 RepID=UPI00355BBCBC
MQLRVWIGTVQRIISGVSENTTSQEVIVALAQATGKTGRFTLVEKWRDYEKTLTPDQCPLLMAHKFGDYAHEVQFILRQTGEISSTNRRLAEAKSPKPQRRRTHLKKSMSFSGGAQSVSPSRSPRLTPLPQHAEEEVLSDSSYDAQESQQPATHLRTPHPRRNVPLPHPADMSFPQPTAPDTHKPTSHSRHERQSPQFIAPFHERPDRIKLGKNKEIPSDQSEKHKQREVENRLREARELEEVIASHERRLKEEERKLNGVDRDISTLTVEEERKWGQLYDCRDEVTKALTTVQHLDVELEDFDEVLLSEEINVLVLRQKEMAEEMTDLQKRIGNCDIHLEKCRAESELLENQIDDVIMEGKHLDYLTKENEEEMLKLEKRVEEKKRFLSEAENGYMSACDDLKEADNSLEKRRQMLIELERELREYNLKTFISTGFSDKYNMKSAQSSKAPGLLV